MTKKIAISVPDDVAGRLSEADIDNVSAYVTEAIRRRINGEQTRAGLAELGMIVTDEGVQRWRERLQAHEARFSPEQRAEMFGAMRSRYEGLGRSVPEAAAEPPTSEERAGGPGRGVAV